MIAVDPALVQEQLAANTILAAVQGHLLDR